MQETSDENDKLRTELFEQADEIEAQVSRMKSMIKLRKQESSTPPRPDDAITSSHNALSESIGHEETPHKPCVYGQKCRFLLQERCSFWHHPKAISLPGSGRFTSRNVYPGTEVAQVKPKENIRNEDAPECQYQNKEGDITRVVSIPICMSESMTNEWDATIENICNETDVSYHLMNTSKSGRNYTEVIIKGSPRDVRETRYLIGQRRKNKELKRKKDRSEAATLSRQMNEKGWQTLTLSMR